eukprot:TRINITY_DN2368_c0_g1_i3.p1 TRINITY_DN2368_c0_g1~~TRINITY_DN2368_c0_g1_i3.p1  ORF type:complete len:1025 (-),score=154.03 TRINITY_DN2368_c0_g1_i3:723-3797(-)
MPEACGDKASKKPLQQATGNFERAQCLINQLWSAYNSQRQEEAQQRLQPGTIVTQPPYHAKHQVLQQRLQLHFQLVDFIRTGGALLEFPTPQTTEERRVIHDMCQQMGLYDTCVSLPSGLLAVSVLKANPDTHPVAILDRFLTVFADFAAKPNPQLEFRPVLPEDMQDRVLQICQALSLHAHFFDDYLLISRAAIVADREGRSTSKEARPSTLPMWFTTEDQELLEKTVREYRTEVEEGEPSVELLRYVLASAPPETATVLPAAPRKLPHNAVDETLRAELYPQRSALPVSQMWQEVVAAVRDNNVSVIMGDTGSGKTTQIPQFILDGLLIDGGNIVVTQPRRISAISVAERVARERGQQVGCEVGYQVRFESALSPFTRLIFCTSGILLRRLHTDPTLKSVRVVIIDEIHERDCNSDFALVILKRLLQTTRTDLKVVLMSATVEPGQFQSYFEEVNPSGVPPVIQIRGTSFPVDEYFLEDAVEWTGFNYDPVRSRKGKDAESVDPVARLAELRQCVNKWSAESGAVYSDRTLGTVARIETGDPTQVQADLICELVAHYDRANLEGAILVFLAGWADIRACSTRLQQNEAAERWLVLPLHSQVSSAEQQRVFQPPPKGMRKIILSTNIAESSVTINDVVVVVDSGVKKEKAFDPSTNMPCLDPCLVAKANAMQRKGRAGRCRHGVCIHLFSRSRWAQLDDYQQPEILRTPLEELALQIKVLNLGEVAGFLKHAMHPPTKAAIDHAIGLLQDIQALDSEQYLTHLGKLLASLPVHPLIGKLLVFGAIFRVLEPIAVIAASLSTKSAFLLPSESPSETKGALQKGQEHNSDHFAAFVAFRGWEHACKDGTERRFLEQNRLSGSTLQVIRRTKSQFIHTLCESGFISSTRDARHSASNTRQASNEKELNQFSEDFFMVTAALQCGLYPNLVWVKGGRKATFRQKLFTADRQLARVHPGSVNFQGIYGDFLVYFERMRSGNGPVYILDSSVVNPLPSVLFANDLNLVMQDLLLTLYYPLHSTLHPNGN